MSLGTLVVNEIYLSLQGESTFAGIPCVFVRLTACNLRCSYCDTAYAFTEGKRDSIDSIINRISILAEPYRSASIPDQRLPLVELTGGEPLLQRESLTLMQRLADQGFTVLVETSGALDVSRVDSRVRRIMDLKCPSSGECDRNLWTNLKHLRASDEIKFVVGSVEDYEWMKTQITTHALHSICPLLVSWVHPLQPGQRVDSLKVFPSEHRLISRVELVERIIADALPVRFQLQMHKIIWPPDQRSV
ncbi:MAG: radical SAM protein [Verrucomicrobia bacterium]|nr:radical SAM protein [Verrucomicrobiota bacterium]